MKISEFTVLTASSLGLAAILCCGCSSGDSSPSSSTEPDAGQPDVVTVDAQTFDTPTQPDQGSDVTTEPIEEQNADSAPDQATDWSGAHTYSGAEGSRKYVVHIPPGQAGSPLAMVMMLHGCQQDANGIAAVTRLDDVADEKLFVTVYPEQDVGANTYGCWNWFLPADQARDAGEPAILHGIAAEVMANVAIDSKRVFVTGLSAGGAMAVVMASTWPDVFASTGVVAGCPFQGTPCLQGASTLPIDTLIGYVHDAMAGHVRVMPLILMQGDADTTVPPANAQLLLEQFLGADDLADDGTANGSVAATAAHHDTGTASGGEGYDVDTYDFAGASLIESWTVHGMGHAWPGGAAGFLYSDPQGPDASHEIYRFLSAHPMP